MKKIIVPILFVLSMIPVIDVSATSGACSFHGGVSCSLSNASKSVICNDGWSDSSTTYGDLQECKSTLCDIGSVTAYQASRGLIGSSFGSSMSQQCLNNNTSINNANMYSGVSDTISIPQSDSAIYSDFNTKDYVNSEMQKYCVGELGINSLYNSTNNYCYCKKGYQPTGTPLSCTKIPIRTKEQVCKDDLGAHGKVIFEKEDSDIFYCGCESGYQFTSNPETCTPVISTPTSSAIESGLSLKLNDVCKETKGSFGMFDRTSGKCSCIDGYELINDTCKQKEPTLPVVDKRTSINNQLSNSDQSKLLATSSSLNSTSTTPTSTEAISPKASWLQRFINWFVK